MLASMPMVQRQSPVCHKPVTTIWWWHHTGLPFSLPLCHMMRDASGQPRDALQCRGTAWRHRQAADPGLQRALGVLGRRQPAPRLRQLRDVALAVCPAPAAAAAADKSAALLTLGKESGAGFPRRSSRST